jgi:hypothetical protein
MTSKSSMQMVGHNLNNDRNKNDFTLHHLKQL